MALATRALLRALAPTALVLVFWQFHRHATPITPRVSLHLSNLSGPSQGHFKYTDFMGDENSLAFAAGNMAVTVMQNHGEAYYVMEHLIRSGTCPADPGGITVLHIDHHDDMGLPNFQLDTLRPGGCRLQNDSECALDNANFLLAAHIRTGALKRILWLYPPHLMHADSTEASSHPIIPPHVCVLGTARVPRRDGRQYYSHRSSPSSAWGLERRFSLFTCGSSPANEEGSAVEEAARNVRAAARRRSSFRREEYVELAGREYELAVLSSAAALSARWQRRLLANGTWFARSASGASWILDLDLDYLVRREEAAPSEYLSAVHERASPLRRHYAEGARLLCALTRQCLDILSEWLRPPPAKPVIERAEAEERLSTLRHVLRGLLPARPCAVTLARSNEGAFTPLGATLMLEDAALDMLRELYGPRLDVHYLRSALGSREQTVDTYAHLGRMHRDFTEQQRRHATEPKRDG